MRIDLIVMVHAHSPRGALCVALRTRLKPPAARLDGMPIKRTSRSIEFRGRRATRTAPRYPRCR
ncbi:hypothetical protein [Burkholderia vietnamiensis]|uniref:hypothetical protein n=1 Tax=Burkholderia vietnamiensis TaxID=60552 RepID=UPI0002EF663C|nr:hypothetical protein [Burkholderia vietnamiensis]KVS20466.1 hypothetical protein WK34_23980 [Burkholderia vietnamiensis]MBH9642660.1 hypothetical protein [Burkholderia vietnamiensis]MBR8004580.1 hypothetical protein [Burkholderia vietnamiensis]MCB4342953.1 hypothetical protein [Burkholderia vietnamiensis]HDR9032731.1 hypothetical protein [Burkholderia vietnamiensis]